MEPIFYFIFAIVVIIILIVWFKMSTSGAPYGFGAIIGRLFFSTESWRRVVWFFSVAFIIGLLYGVYVSNSGTPEGFGRTVFFYLVRAIIIGLILVTIVNLIWIIFRLDEEPSERNKYTTKQRENDLKQIEAKRAQAASIYSKSPVSAKPWSSGF